MGARQAGAAVKQLAKFRIESNDDTSTHSGAADPRFPRVGNHGAGNGTVLSGSNLPIDAVNSETGGPARPVANCADRSQAKLGTAEKQ